MQQGWTPNDKPKKKFDIYERSLNFAARVARMLNNMSKNVIVIEYIKQTARASGSIGANIEEADGALTKKDFVNKLGIARREARETRHWLNLFKKTGLVTDANDIRELNWQIDEASQLLLILSSIINNTKKNQIK